MKVLVVGAGSIGTRHLKNLSEMGHEVYATDINADNLKGVASIAKGTFTSLDDALAVKPDVAFICTYSNSHIAPAMKCANAGCHLFIEKPLSMSMDGIDKLIELVERKKLITMVGCNMRFHPAIAHICETLKSDPDFAKALWAGLESGFYLPYDKPDYQKHYKAKRALGGNLVFDCIHELDYAAWFFGEPSEVVCRKGIISSLKIETEDHAELIVKFKSGTMCSIHLDYLQHSYIKRCKVVCEDGTIVWDFIQGNIGTITKDKDEWTWKDMKLIRQYNQMYVDEVKHYMECVSSKKETLNSIRASLPALKIALAAEKSNKTNRWEKV